MVEAQLLHDGHEWQFTAAATLASGQVLQAPDGRAAVVGGLRGFVTGDKAVAYLSGVFAIKKNTSQALLKGAKIWWDDTNNQADITGNFFIGTANLAAAASDTTVEVALNVLPQSGVLLMATAYTSAATVKIMDVPCKLRLIDMWLVCTDNVAGTVKITDGTNDLTNALTHGTADKAEVRVGTIDDAYHEIAAGGVANIVAATAGNGIVYSLWLSVP